jgi:hypothetical protein
MCRPAFSLYRWSPNLLDRYTLGPDEDNTKYEEDVERYDN